MSKTAAGTEDIRSNNIFIRKNENTRKKDDRMNNNTWSENSMSDSNRKWGYSGKDNHHRMGNRPVRNLVNFGEDMFPELKKEMVPSTSPVNTTTPVKSSSRSSWLDTIKQREDDEKKNIVGINVNDKQYWNGVQWIGPMFMRAKRKTNLNDQSIPNESTDPSINKSDDLTLQSYPQIFNVAHLVKNIEYSRDSVNWYDSWEETFSDEQLEYIRLDEEQKKQLEIFNTMEDYRRKVEYESTKYYNEVGELSEYAKAVYNREEYEKYVNQLETQYYEDDNIGINDVLDGCEYLEEDEIEDYY